MRGCARKIQTTTTKTDIQIIRFTSVIGNKIHLMNNYEKPYETIYMVTKIKK